MTQINFLGQANRWRVVGWCRKVVGKGLIGRAGNRRIFETEFRNNHSAYSSGSLRLFSCSADCLGLLAGDRSPNFKWLRHLTGASSPVGRSPSWNCRLFVNPRFSFARIVGSLSRDREQLPR